MIDNFALVEPLLKWRSDDDFYFLQILCRKKDKKDGQKVNGTNNNSRLIKAYYVKSLENLNFYKPEIIELCKLFNARAGINLNRRSFRKMALQHLRKITEQIINGSEDKSYKAYSSVCGTYNNDTDKKWIVDIDEKLSKEDFMKMVEIITNSRPTGAKVITVLPTKNGEHIITSPFDVQEFSKIYPEISLHKNNPSCLFIP